MFAVVFPAPERRGTMLQMVLEDRLRLCVGWAAVGAVALGLLGAAAQQSAPAYSVRQEWVQADENYLASDALHGRGSGTADELMAAKWVAQRFAEFGLTPAPGLSGFLQAAVLRAPVLDGHARLSAGSVTLDEGKDFVVLSASGGDLSGNLAIAGLGSTPERGAVVLVQAQQGRSSLQAAAPLRRVGAAMLLMSADSSTEAMYVAAGSRTRTPVGLEDGPAPRGGTSMLALKPEALKRMGALKSGQVVSLQVHEVKLPAPRKTYNTIGYLRGTDPNSGTLLLTAHLDHLGVSHDAAGHEVVFHGANDDASGTTAVIELAHALSAGPKPRRSVLFVCYGSEELGELGSTYFGEHPPLPLKELVANLEFEMIGAQDPKMPKGVLLLTGWERSDLGPELKAHGALLGPDPYPEQHFFERSDNYALALDGVVAHTAAGWGTVPTYHQPTDDLAHLDVPFMTGAIQSLVGPVEWLVSSDFVPHWVASGQPKRQ